MTIQADAGSVSMITRAIDNARRIMTENESHPQKVRVDFHASEKEPFIGLFLDEKSDKAAKEFSRILLNEVHSLIAPGVLLLFGFYRKLLLMQAVPKAESASIIIEFHSLSLQLTLLQYFVTVVQLFFPRWRNARDFWKASSPHTGPRLFFRAATSDHEAGSRNSREKSRRLVLPAIVARSSI